MHYVFYPLVAVVCLAIGVLGGYIIRRRIGEAAIGSAEAKAKSIVEEAEKLGETKKKEALIEAKEEILRNKNETERELKERRAEISRLERKNAQKEEALDRKHEAIDRKEEALNRKMKENTEAAEEIERLKAQEITVLEQLSSLTAAEAKSELVSKIEEEAKRGERTWIPKPCLKYPMVCFCCLSGPTDRTMPASSILPFRCRWNRFILRFPSSRGVRPMI